MPALIIASSFCAHAQKKKKTDAEAGPSEVKSREAEFYFTEAEKFFILEDYAKALGYYQKALDLFPDNATIHYKIAEVYSHSSKQSDLVEASLSIEQALKYERGNKFFYLLGVSIYSTLLKFDRAAQLYEAMIQEVPGTQEYLLELAVIYQYANHPLDAIKTYNRAEAIFGIQESTSLQKQKIYAELGKPEEALHEAEALYQAYPDEEQYAVGFAELLSKENQHQKASAVLEGFLAENPSAPAASILLAGLYRDTNQETKARNLLVQIFSNPDVDYSSKLIVLSTYNAELSQSRARNVSDTEKQDFALQLYKLLEAEYPAESNTWILGGDLYLSTGNSKEAERCYLRAVETGEVNFEVWQNLLYLQSQLGDFEAVIKNAERALEYFPNQAILYYFNGSALLQKRKYTEAVFSLEQGKRLSSSNPAMTAELNALLGDAYNGSKEYDKSDRAYEEALAHDPNNYVVLNNYSYYLALRKTSLEKAEKMSALLVKNNPDNPTFQDTYAWVLYARQKYKDARKAIEKTIATGQANATHVEHYGDILFQLGETDQAVNQWERAREMTGKPNETLNKKIANRKIYE